MSASYSSMYVLMLILFPYLKLSYCIPAKYQRLETKRRIYVQT